jgi:predicted ribosomally synthesized peptide with SipW-like signal peptide
MSKKILLSLVTIGVVAGATLGITGAWFSDEEPIEDNKFQAGTVDIKQGVNDLPVVFNNLMPGVATEPQKLTMGNNGSLDVVIDRIYVSAWKKWATSAIEPAVFAEKLNITISDEVGRPIWKGTLHDLGSGSYSDGHGNAVDGTDRVFLAKQGSGVNKTTRDYWFTFELDSSVEGAEWQGADINTTFTVNATQVKDNKFDAAERLVKLQTNNGWDWTEDGDPNTPSASSVHKSNLPGVIGTGLLRAYEFTGNADYFDAAEKSAYEIAHNDWWYSDYKGDNKSSYPYGRTSWDGGSGYTNEDILFLQRMGKYYDDGNYFTGNAEKAIIDRWNAYENDAQAVYDYIKDLRSDPDLFYWDLEPVVEATIDAANTVSDSNQAMVLRNNALDLAELVAADQGSDGWFTNGANNDYQLGQASAIRILQLATDADLDVNYNSEISSAVNALWSRRNSDYSFQYGDKKSIQASAYTALAFEAAGYHGKAMKVVEYIESQQLSNGGWYDEEGETDEYPEVNSEALRAIISVLE